MQNENNSISSNEWGHGNAETTVNEIVWNLNNETVLPKKRLSNKKNCSTLSNAVCYFKYSKMF